MNNRFKRRGATQGPVFRCKVCARRTRCTDQDMPGLCSQCDEWTQIENSIVEGAYRDDPTGMKVAEEHIARLKAEAVAKGGTFADSQRQESGFVTIAPTIRET